MATGSSCQLSLQKGKSLRSLILGYLHNYRNSGQRKAAVDIQYVNIITLIGIPDILASVLIEYSTGNMLMAQFMGLMALLALLNVLVLRLTLNGELASSAVLFIMLAMLSMMLMDGMFQNTAPIWYATFPAVAFFFKGKRRGLLWLGGLLSLLLLIMLGQALELFHSPFSNPALALLFASTVTVGMMVCVYEDMRSRAEASLQEARTELQYLAHTDVLTGLPNRTAFYDHLPRALAAAELEGERLAVMFIDLDNFKPINDTYGHEVGDQLLIEAAERLRNQLRCSDYIARIGGDEFVAVLPALDDKEEAGGIAEKLIDTLALPFSIQGHDCSIGVSIGIGFYPVCASNTDDLVHLADQAMYRVKRSGKNGYAICPLVEGEAESDYKGECRCNMSCRPADAAYGEC